VIFFKGILITEGSDSSGYLC